MLTKFSGVETESLYQSLEKEKENFLCFVHLPYSIKWACEIRKFHVAIVQRRLRNVQKSVIHVQICFFDVFVAVAASLFKLPIVVIQKFCCPGNVMSHFSSLFPFCYVTSGFSLEVKLVIHRSPLPYYQVII